MFPYRHILIAIASTEQDRELLAYAAMLARIGSHAVFRLVHVLSKEADVSESQQQTALSAMPATFGEAQGRVSVSVLRGDRLDSLLGFITAEHVDLVLLGHRKARSGRRSLARRLAMKAPCSVWLVPEGCPALLERVLAPVDFSQRSAESLEIAAQVAAAAGHDHCYAVHARFNAAAVTFDEYENVELAGEREAFDKFVGAIELQRVRVEPVLEESPNITATILRVASEKQCDLIVMGTRGRSRAASILLGSETEQTMMQTTIPLLAVEHPGTKLRLVDALLERRFRNRGDLHFT